MIFSLDHTNLEPFVIGYFQEFVQVEDSEYDKEYYKALGKKKFKMNPDNLFTKEFVMMKNPKVRQKAIEDIWERASKDQRWIFEKRERD